MLCVPDARVVATTDLLLEGHHFRRDWSGARDVGHKAAVRGQADVAAMGAVPTALLVAFAAPPDLEIGWADEFTAGLAAECARGGAAVVGGDVAAAETIIVAVTALGDLQGRPPVTRAGARPGDVVAVSGTLGHSAAGLAMLRRGVAGPAEILGAHRRPQPPYDAGPQAARLGATAMVDVSDGLLADLGHVARASRVLIDLATALLPVTGLLREAAERYMMAVARPAVPADVTWSSGADNASGCALTWVLTGGEDHALAAAFPPGTELPRRWAPVGRVRAVPAGAHAGVVVDGEPYRAVPGWDHFR